MLTPEYLNGAETAKLWEEQNTFFVRIMKEMNLIK